MVKKRQEIEFITSYIFFLLLTERGEIKELVFADIGVFALQIEDLRDLTSFTHSTTSMWFFSVVARISSIYHLSWPLENVKIKISERNRIKFLISSRKNILNLWRHFLHRLMTHLKVRSNGLIVAGINVVNPSILYLNKCDEFAQRHSIGVFVYETWIWYQLNLNI